MQTSAVSDDVERPEDTAPVGQVAAASDESHGGHKPSKSAKPAKPSEGNAHRTGRRSGLGRGLAALIPNAEEQGDAQSARPLDVLFPGRADERTSVARGGSARDLLVPSKQTRSKSRSTAKTRKGRTPASPGTSERQAEPEQQSDSGVEPVETESGDLAKSGTSSVRTPRTRTEASGRELFEDILTGTDDVSRETSSTGPADISATGDRTASDVSRETSEDDMGSPVSASPAGTTPAESSRAGLTHTGTMDSDVARTGADRAEDTTTSGALDEADAADASGASGSDGELMSVPGATFAEIPTSWIIPNHRQPREVFDEDDLAELAASVREVGVLQPVVVRPIDLLDDPEPALLALLEDRPEARYELIMGERRLRASELAGLEQVPAIVRRTEDSDLLRDALLENLHRAQLNPLEEASAYQQLMVDFGATQEELARRIARSRPQIANTLRLLRLPPAVQRKVAAGVISAGHARALLSLEDPEEMDHLAERIVSEGLSVRTTEELVRLGQTRRPKVVPTRRSGTVSPLGERLISRLSEAYDTRVTITEGRRKGKIVIEFAGSEDLERLAQLIAPDTTKGI